MTSKQHYYLPFEKDGQLWDSPDPLSGLSEYKKYLLSFHPERPKYLDYLGIFNRVEECLSSDELGSCIIQTHRAELLVEGESVPVMLIGQQSSPTSDYGKLRKFFQDPTEIRKWNHGMPTAVSYERAVAAVQLANAEHRLIILFVDTAGADPTEISEAGGIAWRIGDTIQALVEADVPTISIIINRACSGGAIALTGTDVTLALEHSTYLVITPEACSSILYHDRRHANEAAAASRITSREGHAVQIVDELVPEPGGPAHLNPDKVRESVFKVLCKQVKHLMELPREALFDRRIEHWSTVGQWTEIPPDTVTLYKARISRIPEPGAEGFIARHRGCVDSNGKRIYDPVHFESLEEENFVCDTCGHRYFRRSAWDYIDLVLDPDSFQEHPETQFILDKDILGFPGYREKLSRTREETGLATAMITGNGKINGREVVFCATDFGFFGGSFCMSSGEKLWRAVEVALQEQFPLIIQAAGGGARMHEGCSSMVSIPKVHVALTRLERAGLPLITIITDPTLGGVAIGYGSRGRQLFEYNAGNIGFSGKRVIEQYTGQKVSRDFQTTTWLVKYGHAKRVVKPDKLQDMIYQLLTAG
ncbi:MAG: carboxyl transferase domain-containing protein [Fidelibacterota bacterium]